MSISVGQVVDALKHRYIDGDVTTSTVNTDDLVSYLHQLSRDVIPKNHSLLEVISGQQPDWIPNAGDRAVFLSVKDCLTMVHNLLEVEPEIDVLLYPLTPLITARLLVKPNFPFEENTNSILSVADKIVAATIGWSTDQGRAGEKIISEIDTMMTKVSDKAADLDVIATDFDAYIDKEQSRITKLEERLVASESGILRSRRGRAMAAEMINSAMEGKQLTEGIAAFLKGPWYESMQLLAITKGFDGEDWIRAQKLTETLIWTYQPQENAGANQQRMMSIIEHLPSEVHDLLLALEHNSGEAEAELAEIEADHIAVISGQGLEYANFELIDTGGEPTTEKPAVSKILLRKVNHLEEGQWFLYDNKGKQARIKLILKLDDVKQLLFTNRNGMKALDTTFDEMAYFISSGMIKPLVHHRIFSDTFKNFYQGLIDNFVKKREADEAAEKAAAKEEAARQKALAEAEEADRNRLEELERQQAEAKTNRMDRARAEAAKPENKDKLDEIAGIVSKLNTGAWLKLPAADGTLEECKLAVRVGEKLIFVSQAGVKMGDFTSDELIALLVAGEAEIADVGVEFEDTLAQVVSKLRTDRTKSYDDLTGGE